MENNKDQLRKLLEQHHSERKVGAGDGNVFVEVLFPSDNEEGEPNIQYQIGVLNFAGLEGGQKQRAIDVCEDANLSIQSDFDRAVTGFGEGMSAEEAFDIIDRALTSVYDTQWNEIVDVREREL